MPSGVTRRGALAAGAAAGLGALIPARAWAGAAGRVRTFGLEVPRSAWTHGRHTHVLRAPSRFDLIGVRTRDLARAGLELRVRRAGGGWSAWMPFGAGTAHAPDRPRVPGGSDPIWTGGSDEFQLRARGRTPGTLQATFVAAPAGMRHAGAQLRQASSTGGASTTGPPTIIPRAAWHADQAPPRAAPAYGDVQMAFVHHTDTANDYGPGDSAAIVLSIAKYHIDSNGWNDIGYNLLVDQYGQIFEGRAGGVDLAVIGAHTQGWNSHSTGIATIGTFEAVAFPQAGFAALARLIAYKLSLHGVPIEGPVSIVSAGGADNRYKSGVAVTFQRVSGHRDGCSTDCPGDVLYGQLPALRTLAAGQAGSAAAKPRLTVAPPGSAVAYGETATFTGRLVDGGGNPLAGAQITLAKLGASKSYIPLLHATTAPDGTWSVGVPWKRAAAVRADAVVAGYSGTIRSSPVTVALTPALTLGRAPARVLAGRSVPLSGSIRPGGAVTVRLEREVTPGHYAVVGYVPLKVSGTRFGGAVRLSRAGLYRLTVRTGAKSLAAAAPAIAVRAVHSAGSVGTASAPLAPIG